MNIADGIRSASILQLGVSRFRTFGFTCNIDQYGLGLESASFGDGMRFRTSVTIDFLSINFDQEIVVTLGLK